MNDGLGVVDTMAKICLVLPTMLLLAAGACGPRQRTAERAAATRYPVFPGEH